MINDNEHTSQFLFYAATDGTVKVQVIVADESVWASQKGLAEIFAVDVCGGQVISDTTIGSRAAIFRS